MLIQEIRQSFLDYFQSKGHLIEPSAPLVPMDDPSLLFTTAGMVPYKDYFAGSRKPPSSRIASVQKCFRTTDLEEVGRTKRHHSFFEMLGNFSFGDYFKKEAIEFAWEFATEHLPFKKDDIWISIYLDDDEAYDLWHKHMGVSKDRIVRLGKADNFWGPAGSTGACGPCSELYLDRGEDYKCAGEPCQPGDDGERFMEFWNLVFNQFNLTADGTFAPLNQTGIDTGAGLERLATLVQGVDSVYDTNELSRIIHKVEEVYGVQYEGDNIIPIRVLTDHARALTFSMADGIFPSNESRGYVLRRLLRRALLFGRKLGQKDARLFELVSEVTDIYGPFYPELVKSENLAGQYIKSEENRFLQTLDDGFVKLTEIIDKTKDGAYGELVIPGKEIFVLYDTFGFPPEMTSELAQNENLGLDMSGFETEMDKQRARGKSAWKGSSAQVVLKTTEPTIFTGYDHLKSAGNIVELIFDNKNCNSLSDSEAGEESQFIVVADKTPCYAEGGGQVGDRGRMSGEGFSCQVTDTRKIGDVFYHVCDSLTGKVSVSDSADLEVDEEKRDDLEKNHSVTHLLNAALRHNLGDHIKQSGSLVEKEYLRFDFTHHARIDEERIQILETDINDAITRDLPVATQTMGIEDAKKTGALMAFGEKYGDTVRVISMGDYSVELCGGTHVSNTKQIGLFIITKESSPGAGNRRIEAMSGRGAERRIKTGYDQFFGQIETLKSTTENKYLLELEAEARHVIENVKSYSLTEWHLLKKFSLKLSELELKVKKEKKKTEQKVEIDSGVIADIMASKTEMEGLVVVTGIVEGGIPYLKSLADSLRTREPDTVFILASSENGKWNLVMATTGAYAQNHTLDMGKSFKNLLQADENLSGGGGGKKELAQGSGKIGADQESTLKLLMESGKKSLRV